MSPSVNPTPRRRGLVVVGSVNVDRTVVVDRFPQPGETLSAASVTTSIGGKGANQAIAAACSGADVMMVGVVGDDEEGETAVRTLDAAGVDTTGMHRAPDRPTGTAWITVASRDNTIVVVPGANHEWPQGLSNLPLADVVLCQLEIPLPVVRAAAAPEGTFILNAAPSCPLDDELLQRCDVLIVNEHELGDVSGVGGLDTRVAHSLVTAARKLIARGVTTVVTTLGRDGAILCTADDAIQVEAPTTPLVVDTTGAGDAFCGVFAAHLARGDSLERTLRYAVTAGSLSVRHPTAQGGYDELAGLDSLITQTPYAIPVAPA